MSYPRLFRLLLAFLTVATLLDSSCSPAQYEIIRGKKGKNTEHTGDPNKIDKPTTGEDTSTSTGNIPPSAHVEVILNGVSVTTIQVNRPVSIRPSADTLDPDDVGKSPCANPGIIRADYNVNSEASPSASRSEGCEALSVPYTFTRTGRYQIDMTVTSNENETAFASMILTVVDANVPVNATDGGFSISANPIVAGKGQTVTFTSKCDSTTTTTITWDFGDGTTATGQTVTHIFQQTGQFKVEATCTDANGKTKTAVLTEVIVDQPISGIPTVPGFPNTTVPDPNNPNPGTNPADPNQPGQNPGQDPGQNTGDTTTTPPDSSGGQTGSCTCQQSGGWWWY